MAIRILNEAKSRNSCRYIFKQKKKDIVPAVYIFTCAKYVHVHLGEHQWNNSMHDYNTREADS